MTHILAIAIILLVLSFYLNTITFIFPLTFSYLLLIYALKDIPKSTYQKSLLCFGILGTTLSLIAPHLTIIHEVIILICVMICAWMMDPKSYHGILSGLCIAIVLPLTQMIRIEHGNHINFMFFGFLLLIVTLYYFYYHFNLYLSDIELSKKPKKKSHLSISLKMGLCLILTFASLGIYQELMMNLSQQPPLSLFTFEQVKFDTRVRYEQPIYVNSSESKFSQDQIKVDAFYFDSSLYRYEAFDIEIGFLNPETPVLNFNCIKKKDAPDTINTVEFKLSDYYYISNLPNKINYMYLTAEHLKSAYQGETLYIDILGTDTFHENEVYWSHPISPDTNGAENRIILAYQPQPSNHHGRSLWMSVSYIWYPNNPHETSIHVTFSPFVEPLLNRANLVQYKLIKTNKLTKETEIIGENESKKTTNSNWNYDCDLDCYLTLPKTMDFENNDYTFVITYFKDEKAIFHQEAVIQP